MVLLGQINNPRACKAFTDFLTVQNIAYQVAKREEQLAILVPESQLELAQPLFQEFISNPNQDKYLQASWQVNQPLSGATQSLGLAKIWQANGPLTKAITLICIGIYWLSSFGYFSSIFEVLSFSWQVDQGYRLLTPAIMHLSAVHLAFNMSWWWYLGGKVEHHLGMVWLLFIAVLTALLSNIAQASLLDTHFAGLSGVNYGLAGFVWLYGHLSKDANIQLANNVFGFLLVWMCLGFAELLPINMANWAHLVGLLTGMALAQLFWRIKKADPK